MSDFEKHGHQSAGLPKNGSGAQASDAAMNECDALRRALREADARFRGVIDGSLQGIIVQQDDRIVYANLAMADLFGYSEPSKMIGLSPFEDLIAEADLGDFRARTAAAYAGGRVAQRAAWHGRRPDKNPIWVVSTAHSSEWEGRPAVTSFYLDITERKKAEVALHESEGRYRSALRAGRMGAWETDLVTKTRMWTEEGMALFGISLPGGRGQVGGDADEYVLAIHPDDRGVISDFYEAADKNDSFPAEYRIVRPDGTIHWLSGRGQVVSRAVDGRAHRLVSVMADVTERKVSELNIQILLRELTHRSKNLMSVIQAIVRQMMKTSVRWQDFQTQLNSRLLALATSHDVLILQDWKGAPLRELIREQLVPFYDRLSQSVVIEGPEVRITVEAAQTIGLVIHELASNAVRFGALSIPSGKVDLNWKFETDDGGRKTLSLCWKERNGPPVVEPTRKGFGYIVLHDIVSKSLNASVMMNFAIQGVEWVATIPADSQLIAH